MLQRLLGQHVFLMVEVTRDRIGGVNPRTSAALDAVDVNTKELNDAIASLFGNAEAETFTQLWSAHVRQIFDYAAALNSRDEAAQTEARTALRRTEHDLAHFLSVATGGRNEAAMQAAIRMHIEGLLDQANAYAAAEYGRAYSLAAEGFRHMVMVADSLAAATVIEKGIPLGDFQSPKRNLQSALSGAFAEHMGLMVETMRAGVDGSRDFGAVGATLNRNTSGLGDAVRALYGDSAAGQFLTLWAQHVNALVSYAAALAAQDDAREQAARRSLADFATRMAAFLASATNQRLPAIELSAALTEHDDNLMSQADAYAARDYAGSEQTAARGYAHMFMLAEVLATAVGDAVAARLPRGGVATGGGGTAPSP